MTWRTSFRSRRILPVILASTYLFLSFLQSKLPLRSGSWKSFLVMCPIMKNQASPDTKLLNASMSALTADRTVWCILVLLLFWFSIAIAINLHPCCKRSYQSSTSLLYTSSACIYLTMWSHQFRTSQDFDETSFINAKCAKSSSQMV